MAELHAHFESASRDCDGLYTRGWVETMNDDERSSEFADIAFHNRVVGNVVNTYSCLYGGRLEVVRMEDDDMVRISWSEETDEGYRNVEARFCTDDCDVDEHSYRDHTAESMGY